MSWKTGKQYVVYIVFSLRFEDSNLQVSIVLELEVQPAAAQRAGVTDMFPI